jgi:hypothetical protein
MSIDFDKHAANLGRVIAHLQSLEFALRTFLFEAEGN